MVYSLVTTTKDYKLVSDGGNMIRKITSQRICLTVEEPPSPSKKTSTTEIHIMGIETGSNEIISNQLNFKMYSSYDLGVSFLYAALASLVRFPIRSITYLRIFLAFNLMCNPDTILQSFKKAKLMFL